MTVVLVFALDLHLEVLRALVASFEILPVGDAGTVVTSAHAAESSASQAPSKQSRAPQSSFTS